MMRLIRAIDSAIPPRTGTHPPTYPCPDPRVVTGIFSREAIFITPATDAVERAKTTTSGADRANHLSPAAASRDASSVRTPSIPATLRNSSMIRASMRAYIPMIS